MARSSSWRAGSFAGDRDAQAAADWMLHYGVTRMVDSFEQWRRAEADEPREWREAADLSDYMLTLTPEQVRDLTADLHAVIERHRRTAEPGPDSRRVHLYVYAVPRKETS